MAAVAVSLLTGCETVPPGTDRGPHGTLPYNVTIEASEPDVQIHANGEYVGTAPMTLKIYGDKDGTFHTEWSGDRTETDTGLAYQRDVVEPQEAEKVDTPPQ